MKTVLILGGYGFLGTNIMKYVDANLPDQYHFVVFDKVGRHQGGVTFDCLSKKSYTGDFSDSELLASIFKNNIIDLIIHALSTTVPVDSANARYDVESNLLPSLNVLSLMVQYGVRDIVYISSGGAVYGTRDNKPHAEADAVYPISSYGVVKLAVEKYLMQYAQLYGIRPLILRLSNPYGPYHYSIKQGVVNIALTKALHDEPFYIWGEGRGCKDYIYVEDFVKILFLLLAKGIHSIVLNLASGQILSVNDIVLSIRKLVPGFQVYHTDAQIFDASHFELDLKTLHSIIGMFPFTPFEEGLRKTYYWTKSICD